LIFFKFLTSLESPDQNPFKLFVWGVLETQNVHTKTKIKLVLEKEIVKIIIAEKQSGNSPDKWIANMGGTLNSLNTKMFLQSRKTINTY